MMRRLPFCRWVGDGVTKRGSCRRVQLQESVVAVEENDDGGRAVPDPCPCCSVAGAPTTSVQPGASCELQQPFAQLSSLSVFLTRYAASSPVSIEAPFAIV